MTSPASEVSRLRGTWQRVLAALAVAVLPWLVAPGLVQPDTKLDLTVSPWRYLARATSAWSDHNGVGELQNQAYGYLFPMGPVHGGLLAAGMPPWAVQRVWWALILVVAFVGAERLLRRLGVPATVPAIAGALVYALSPRVLTMLAESSVELWPYAVAPWLVLVATGAAAPGAGVAQRRRMALRTAALVVCLGGVNATVNLAAVAPAALWIVLAGRGRGRWRALLWWSVAALAGSLWWLGPLLVLGRYSYPFLDYIELASTTTAVTTVVNVLRGADHWIAYLLTDAGHPVWQSGWVLAQSAVAVVATCLLAGLGLTGLVRGLPSAVADRAADADRAGIDPAHVRRWAVTALLLGVVLMSVGRSGTASGPLSEVVRDLLDGPLAPLRNVHKADLLVRLPMALGVSVVAVRIGARRAGDVWRRRIGVAALTVALLGSLLPLWQGRVADAWGYEAIPLSVRQTAADIDAAGTGSTMVLPAARMAHQSWGRTNDDPLSALAQSPVIARAAAPLGHPGATRLMDRVDRLASSGRAQPELVTALQRLGVDRVVVRHDVTDDEPTLDPDQVEATLEATPGIDFVRTRGAGATALTQWRVLEPSTDISSHAVADVQVAATAPEGVVDLEASGLVAPGAPVVLAGDARPLGRGPDVVTDGLRWQLYNAGRPPHVATSPSLRQASPWPTLTGTRALPPGDEPAWATTRTWPGYESVEVSSSSADPFAAGRGPASSGPAALLDDDPTTTWVSAPGDARPTIRLVPTSPTTAREVVVGLPDGQTRPRQLVVRLDPGEGGATGFHDEVPVPQSGATLDLVVPSGYGRIEIAPVPQVAGGQVGITGIDLGGVALPVSRRPGTALTLPDASGARAVLLGRDPRAAADLAEGEDPASLRRSVSGLDGPLGAQVMLRPRSGEALELLLDGGWDLGGSTRGESTDVTGSTQTRPGAALDGDPTTRWEPRPDESAPVLRIDLGQVQQVSELRLGQDVAGLVRVTTDAGVGLVPARQGRLDVPVGMTRTLELRFERRGEWVAPEIQVVGPARSFSGTVTLPCGQAGSLRVDGSEVPLAATTTVDQLRSGSELPATLCGPLPHAAPDGIAIEAVAGEALVPQRVVLTTATSPVRAERPRPVGQVAGAVDRLTVEMGGGAQSLLATSQGANEGWRAADPDGHELVPVTVDGWRQGFLVPGGDATTITVRFAPSTAHQAGLLLGGALALICVLGGAGSLLRERRGTRVGPVEVEPSAVGEGTSPRWVGILLGALVGILVAGLPGLVAGAVGGLLPRRLRGVALAATLTVAGVALAVLGAAEQFSTGALVAQVLGAAALGVLSATLVTGPAAEPGGAPGPLPDGPS